MTRARSPIRVLLAAVPLRESSYGTRAMADSLRDGDRGQHVSKAGFEKGSAQAERSSLLDFLSYEKTSPPQLPSTPALPVYTMSSSVSVRRLVALFDSSATLATATRAAAVIGRTRVSALVRVYEPTSGAAVDAVPVAASCVAAASAQTTAMSIADIDYARFAAFGNPHEPSENGYLRYTSTTTTSMATTTTTTATTNSDVIDITRSTMTSTTATAISDASDITDSSTTTTTAISDAIDTTRSTRSAQPLQASPATNNPTPADAAVSAATPTPATPALSPAPTSKVAHQLNKMTERASHHLQTTTTCVGKAIEEETTLQPARAPRRNQSRLLQYQTDPTFLRKCWQARQRRAAAAASKRIWKP
ncbi:unnamed protein product [Phytophthora fragariaefolia]|uniref:Unnamed protein product n=1 Tax=Phytophthora fragariaefolia TaxID=1490495 RepID=A0A9W6WXM8_9STRA|nr:unnamed protein product [Phytophthora fragariaefolia]